MNAELVHTKTFVNDFLVLIKFRIGLMVVFSTSVGYVLGMGYISDPIHIFHVLFATFLTTSGTGVLNQFMERERDARMGRTADRPLPAGRIAPELACWFGLILSGMGIIYLGVLVNGLTALVGALNCGGIFALLYAPKAQNTVQYSYWSHRRRTAAGGWLDRSNRCFKRRSTGPVWHFIFVAISPFLVYCLALPRRLRTGRISHAAHRRSARP